MTDPSDPFRFTFEPGELKLPEIVAAIQKVLLDLPDLTAMRAAVSPAFWASAAGDAVGMVRKLASVSLGEVLIGGWQQHARFAKYADPVKFPPDKVTRVPLADHDITSTYEPYIQLLVDGKPAGRIPLEVGVKLTVEGAVLVIQGGRFMRVEAGRARLTGSLKCAKTTICERATRDFTWPKGLSFGDEGVRIAAVM